VIVGFVWRKSAEQPASLTSQELYRQVEESTASQPAAFCRNRLTLLRQIAEFVPAEQPK
jgi:hypothetical protein